MPKAAASSRSAPKRSAPQRSKKAKQPQSPQRVLAVWATFVGAMTLVGGGLWLGNHRNLADVPTNLAVQPLMATASATSVESVLRNIQSQIQPGRWQAIVIHDSATTVATPAQLDQRAKDQGLRGIGYHFVLGNGNGMSDGELHATARWLTQQPGAHTAGQNADWFNRQAIGICLVGDGDRDRFSPAQTRRLLELVDLLRTRLNIPADRIYLHNQLAPTTSPGRYFPETTLRAHLRGG
jgi:N-acetyl-anhydromuramyl-L-alanine amidase AmpD